MSQILYGKLLQYVFSSMEDAVCVTEQKGVLRYANPSAKKLLGISGSSNEARKIWQLFPIIPENDDLIQLLIDMISSGKKVRPTVVDYMNADGKEFRLRISMNYAMNEDEKYIVFVMTDLTELTRVNSAFARYTSSDIAEYVLKSPEGEKQGGHEREVSILMSDLRGFTSMGAAMAPSDLVTVLNHYFEKMVEVIEKNHGTIIEFLGDGIFAVFGAPKQDPRHAFHAVACAIGMQNAMIEVNDWNRENCFPELEMGIGVNSGLCVVGNIGSPQKMKYGCMGDTVNLAGRTENFTIGRQIYITENTRALLDRQLIIAGEHSFIPKGGTSPLTIYDVHGLGKQYRLLREEKILWSFPAGEPQEVSIHTVYGKLVEDASRAACLTALSKDRRYALMRTDAELKDLQNIMLRLHDDVYAKVIGREERDYRICFTSKPASFDDWAKEFVKGGREVPVPEENSGLEALVPEEKSGSGV